MVPSFRLGLAVWLVGLAFLGILAVRLGSDPSARLGGDWMDYRTASLRLLDGQPPYAPAMLDSSVAAQGVDRYRYPPPFAQLITPLAVLPESFGLAAWTAIQAVLLFASAWLGLGAVPRAPERFVWAGAATTWFLPTFAALWTGNAVAPLGLAVGALLAVPAATPGGRRMGAGTGAVLAIASVVKLTPLALLPAVLRRRGATSIAALASIAILVIPSIVIAPRAWAAYATVLPNILAGDVRYANNLAPAVAALTLGAQPIVSEAVRVATLGVAGALIAASFVLARRPGGWAAAVGTAVVASLLVPGVLWYQYLVELLPLAAYAWLRAGAGTRVVLLVSGILASAGVAFAPLALVGAAALAGSSLIAVWPRAEALVVAARGGEAQVPA